MRIVVATTSVPFASGSADAVADALAAACRGRGDAVDRVRLPRGVHVAAACRLTDVGADRVLCLDARAALLEHPARRVWLVDPDGLEVPSVRAAVAGAPAVRAADEDVRARLAAADVPAQLLPLPRPDDADAWTRAAAALVR
ncbi:hypothetical protein [Patulibacter sp. SYSU D01012]|uniref:hypothetical protein n=1 Tax=Patulibacter sp. SYSU D01012 TaxID=2817381 RepID=UPI001B304AC8|nr:hypothetical protein [Patulibacter sp. SYSU D01012]